MKKLTLALFAAIALVAIAPAQGGHPMKGHDQMMGKGKMSVMDCCMQGLSAAEKKTAMDMIKHGTPAQHAVMQKRCTMCMNDPHTALQKMDHSKITEQMKMQHMMSGMSPSDQKTIMGMMSKMTPAQKAVCEKMCMNCCMYGMKHAPHKIGVRSAKA